MLNSTQFSTSICVRARVNHCYTERKTRGVGAHVLDGDGEHLSPACNADEGEQVLDEVQHVASVLALRRYLILKLSWLGEGKEGG